jgi:hypothetical protein
MFRGFATLMGLTTIIILRVLLNISWISDGFQNFYNFQELKIYSLVKYSYIWFQYSNYNVVYTQWLDILISLAKELLLFQ